MQFAEIRVAGIEDVRRMFSDAGLGDSVPKALKVAINETGKRVRDRLTAHIKGAGIFDRPNPRTQSSIRYVSMSDTKNRPESYVEVSHEGDGGIAPVKYLWAEIHGGQRALKRSEVMLREKGILPRGMITRPGPHADIDQYGNMKGGQIVQILSQLQAFSEVGYRANANKPGSGKYSYFVKKNKGIFRRVKGARGAIEAMMFFVKSPTYKKRFDFYGIGQEAAAHYLPIEASKSLDYALKHY